jgi:hypothetical protein
MKVVSSDSQEVPTQLAKRKSDERTRLLEARPTSSCLQQKVTSNNVFAPSANNTACSKSCKWVLEALVEQEMCCCDCNLIEGNDNMANLDMISLSCSGEMWLMVMVMVMGTELSREAPFTITSQR